MHLTPPRVPTRALLSTLQDLLLDDPIVSSNYAFVDQVQPHLKTLASTLDTMEHSLSRCFMSDGFAGVMNKLLRQGSMEQLRQSREFNKFHYMCLAHMMMAYRILQVLSNPKASAGYRREIYPRTLTEAPTGRVYVVSHLEKWHSMLRTASSLVDACERQLLLAQASQSGPGGAVTLASRLESFGSLKDAEGAIACLQNVQAASINLAFILNGCSNRLSEGSDILVPDLPSTPEIFIQETERISGAKLQPSALKRIETLVQKSLPNLRIQLLSAALISPILLFQPFVIEYKSWNKQNLIETSFKLGNDPPAIIRKVNGILWRLLERLAISAEAGSVVQEVSAMFKTIPWHELADDAISTEARDWFKCNTDSSGKVDKHGAHAGPSSSQSSSMAANLVDEGSVEARSGLGGSNDSSAAEGADPIAAAAGNQGGGRRDVATSTETKKTSKKNRKRTRKTLTGDEGDEVEYVPQPTKRTRQALEPTSSPADGRSSPFLADRSTEALRDHVQEECPTPPPFPAPSPPTGTGAVPAPVPFFSGDPPSTTPTNETGAAPQPFVSLPRSAPAPGSPLQGNLGLDGCVDTTLSQSTRQATPSLSVMKQSTPSPYFLSFNTYDDPVDVEHYYYAHHRSSVAPRDDPPTSSRHGACLQETSEYITGYTIDGRSLALYVQYICPKTLQMIRDAVGHVANYPDEALHCKDADDGGSRSTICDWDHRITNRWMQYRQDSLRWKVAVFSTGKVEPYQNFRAAVLRTMDRYGNDIVIHDQSVSDDPHDPLSVVVGTVDLLTNESLVHFNTRRKIYYIPPMASSRADDYFDRLYCSETVAYEATHARSAKFHLFQHPAQALSYRAAALAGGVEYWQMAPAGLGVAITVEIGEIHVIIATPVGASLFNTHTLLSMEGGKKVSARGAHEAVWLRAGNRIVIPPCTLYFIWTVKDMVCHKRYFYTGVHMPMTQIALAHSLVLGALASRDPVSPAVAFPILCRMMVCWHTFLMRRGRSEPLQATTETFRIDPENDIAFHLPSLEDIESVLDLFSLLNTIILLPVYDTRTYSPDSHQPTAALSESEKMLFRLARQCALQVGKWFFQEYRLLSPDGGRYLDGKEEFWSLSLLHHANTLLRYKLVAEKKKPQFSQSCTANQLQQEIHRCLKPFEQEIQNLIDISAQQALSPEYKMALFLDAEGLQQLNDNPNEPIPVSLWNSYHELSRTIPLPSVVKRAGNAGGVQDAIDL